MTAEPESRFLLRVITASNVPLRRYALPPGEYVVGSGASADVLLPVSGVSRMHARIEVGEEGPLEITDLGSRNGTFVDGTRIDHAEVAHAVTVAFGPVLLTVAPADEMTDSVSGLVPQPSPPKSQPHSEATRELTVPERLAEGTALVVGLLVRGSVTPAEGALRLAHEWRRVLGTLLVEIVHQPAHGPRVTLTVSDPASPTIGPGLEVEGEGGWRVVVTAPAEVELDPLRPVARVALAALAAASGHGPGGLRLSASLRLQDTVVRAEREALLGALARAGGDASRAATILGVSRTTCQRKLRELGLLAAPPAEPPKS